jgi:F0F1-type ATP synthase beta subunit
MANEIGRVVQILGGVVDVEFSEGDVPDLFEAIEIER